MTVINNKYDFGATVYVKTDLFQYPRMVLSFEVFKNGEIMYKVGQGTDTSAHYEFELSSKLNILIKLSD